VNLGEFCVGTAKSENQKFLVDAVERFGVDL